LKEYRMLGKVVPEMKNYHIALFVLIAAGCAGAQASAIALARND
jgi:hypothetical protein